MEKTGGELNRLCGVYGSLSDDEKGKIIRLAEGLLTNQNNLKVKALSVEKPEEKKSNFRMRV